MFICYLLHVITAFVFIKHQFGLTDATVNNVEDEVNSFFPLYTRRMKNGPIYKREILDAQSYNTTNEIKVLSSLENNVGVSQEFHNIYGSNNLNNSQESTTPDVYDATSMIDDGLSEENITEQYQIKAASVNSNATHSEISAKNISSSIIFESGELKPLGVAASDQTEHEIESDQHLPTRSGGFPPVVNEVNYMTPNIDHHYPHMLGQSIIVNSNANYGRGSNGDYIYMRAPPEVPMARAVPNTNYGPPNAPADAEFLKNPVVFLTPISEQLMHNDSYLALNSNSGYNIQPVLLPAQQNLHSPGIINGYAGVTYQQMPFTAPNVIFQRVSDFPVNFTGYEEREENSTKAVHPRGVPQALTPAVQSKASSSLTLPKLTPAGSLIPKEETELERAERVNKAFERMIQFVNILGQVDTYITDRAKTAVRKLALLYEDDDDDDDRYYSRSRKRRH